MAKRKSDEWKKNISDSLKNTICVRDKNNNCKRVNQDNEDVVSKLKSGEYVYSNQIMLQKRQKQMLPQIVQKFKHRLKLICKPAFKFNYENLAIVMSLFKDNNI